MGLDLLEFAWTVENAFGIHIPEQDSARLETPALLIDYLADRLLPATSAQCTEQVAFYRLRAATMRVLQQPRQAIRPETEWVTLLPTEKPFRRHSWELLHHAISLPAWPKLSWLDATPRSTPTVGATATFIATRCPGALKGATGVWTKDEITRIVRRLMVEELAVTDFKLTDRFAEDLGLT